jgi:hypothetical protein
VADDADPLLANNARSSARARCRSSSA